MTFDQMMERFWSQFSKMQRRCVETDWRYQDAIKEANPAKAQDVALAYLCGTDRAKLEFIADTLQRANALCPD
jgi:hypothetical protein